MIAPGLDPADCVDATSVIDSDSDCIRALADELAADAADDANAVRAMFDYVRDEIVYHMAPAVTERQDWRASDTVQRGYGFCHQKAVVLAALVRARGIPSALGMETLLDHKIPPHLVELIGSQELSPHGYTLVFVNGRWQRVDASLDSTLCAAKGYRVVEYAPGSDQLLPATDVSGKPHFDHVRPLGEWSDLPDEIVSDVLELGYLRDAGFVDMATRNGPSI